MLVGVTRAIEKYRTAQAILGERFLKLSPRVNADAAISKAAKTRGKEREMREKLSKVFYIANSYWGAKIDNKVAGIDNLPLSALARVTAQLRSQVARDRSKQVIYLPEYEIGTRLVKQLAKIVQAGAAIYEHETAGEPEYRLALRVSADSIPTERKQIIDVLLREDNLETNTIARKAKLPLTTTKLLLEDMWLLKIIEREGDENYQWALNSKVRQLLIESRLPLIPATQIV